ncbi:hypothetical protein GCK32_019592 [Trichostrongylus colubriformis]|uniref:Uncharacterized protein n=1 Tax=Trichostrongylus colubriformis TaxID=6319 RepID=A0AAN8EX55_TRICO
MLPARTQLPNVIPEDSEECDEDEVPPMQAPKTRAIRRLSETIPPRKHTPFANKASTSLETKSVISWRSQEEQPTLRNVAKRLEALDEENGASPSRSRTPSNAVHEFACPRLSNSVMSNMIRLSVLSEGRSRFGVVSKFINKTTMVNYAVVEWNVKSMNTKGLYYSSPISPLY